MSDQVLARTTDIGNRLLLSCRDSLAMDIVTNIINFRPLRRAIAIMSLPNQQTRSFPVSLRVKYSFSFLFILLSAKSMTISCREVCSHNNAVWDKWVCNLSELIDQRYCFSLWKETYLGLIIVTIILYNVPATYVTNDEEGAHGQYYLVCVVLSERLFSFQ